MFAKASELGKKFGGRKGKEGIRGKRGSPSPSI